MQKTLYAGDTLKQPISLAEFPASEGWVHQTRLAPQSGEGALTIAAAPNADDFTLTISSAVSSPLEPGKWTYTQWVEKAGERYTVAEGEITILVNPANAATGIDTRSHVKKTLDALELMIEGKAGRDVQSYTINGRQLQHYDIGDLLKMRDKYKAEYANELSGGKPRKGGKIHVRM
jgi:hypothetical protein